MSKISDIALQLDEQAVEYGLQGYQEALERGFTYEVAQDGTATLISPSEGLEMAHKEWLKKKQIILGDLNNLLIHQVFDHDIISRAIELIKEAHD